MSQAPIPARWRELYEWAQGHDAGSQELIEEIAALEAQVQLLREVAYRTIDRFQDIISWQPGESRNRLVCEIRDAVDAALAVTEKKA